MNVFAWVYIGKNEHMLSKLELESWQWNMGKQGARDKNCGVNFREFDHSK